MYRWRYALITRAGESEAFSATFANHPDRATIPDEYRSRVERLYTDDPSSWKHALAIAEHLSTKGTRGPGLGEDSTSALKAILEGRGGTCSDFAQVYWGLANAAGIPTREWGLCWDLLDTHRGGHAFNEIYCEEKERWVFVDPTFSIYATLRSGGPELSVSGLVDLVMKGCGEEVHFHFIDPQQETPQRVERLRRHYLDCRHIFFCLSNYNPFEQDEVLRKWRWLPLALQNLFLLFSGHYQRFEVYRGEPANAGVDQRLEELERWLRSTTVGPGVRRLVTWATERAALRSAPVAGPRR